MQNYDYKIILRNHYVQIFIRKMLRKFDLQHPQSLVNTGFLKKRDGFRRHSGGFG